MLDKHKLALQLSTRKVSSAVKSKKQADPEKQSTKLVVRNVAFEATRKDVMSLFSPFGHMKSCRLPRKFDGTPRCVCASVLFKIFEAFAWLFYFQHTVDPATVQPREFCEFSVGLFSCMIGLAATA